MYTLILAGGTGTRLWPRSRKQMPKQLLDIVAKNTMLQETFTRISPLIPPDKIFVVTNDTYASIVRKQIPVLPPENVINEPSGHGTAPCIGLSALYLKRRNPEEVMASLHADHLIDDEPGFREALQAAEQVAKEGYLVTLGIEPSGPETGYGYIQRGDLFAEVNNFKVYHVQKFTEKPDSETAKNFVESGLYYWNSGIFLWKVSTILKEIEKHLPNLYAKLMLIDKAIGTEDERKVLEEVWETVEGVSIDIGVMEKADQVLVIPVDIGWSDVGSWATLADILPRDSQDNVVVGGKHIGVDTTGSLLYGTERLIATVGLKDMIVVDTEDVVLVCPKNRAQDVKDLVDKLRAIHEDEYL
ncbi:MAG: mannose-1-phosphate guanylyltransferase [Anaerolineae bacterium]